MKRVNNKESCQGAPVEPHTMNEPAFDKLPEIIGTGKLTISKYTA